MNEIVMSEEATVEQSVQKALQLISAQRRTTLISYWGIGQLANNLNSIYGDGTVKKFAEGVSAQSGVDCSPSLIYRMRQFHTKYTDKEVATLADSKICWTQVVKLLPEAKDEVMRAVGQVADGALSPGDIVSTVQDAASNSLASDIPPDKIAREPSSDLDDTSGTQKSIERSVAQLIISSESLLGEMGTIVIVLDELQKLPAPQQRQHQESLKALVSAMSNLEESIRALQPKFSPYK